MIKSLKYTSFAAVSLAMLAACTSDEVEDWNKTLSGGSEKTPLEVTALLDAGSAPQTRAADKDFASGDQIVAYLRHVTWNGGTSDRNSVSANKAPKLVTFTTGASETYSGEDITPIGTGVALGLTNGTDGNTKQAASLTPDEALYWDDFSVSSANGSTDLRTANHYLQSYYGYCYNGRTIESPIALTETSGELTWSILTDQNTSDNFKKSDLLWSAEQNPEPYAHATYDGGIAHGKIVLPFTHAMSKVTINLTADKGFADSFKFTDTSITLEDVNTVCTAIAPTATLSSHGTPADVKMQQVKATEAKKATYSAIIVPTTLTKDNIFATINDADGNNYAINVTQAMLATATATTGGWGGQLTSGMTKSGVHYVLNVTLSKQSISVIATIRDWDQVTAEGTGLIQFNADVKTTDKSNEVTDGSFDLWMSKTNADASYGDKASTYTYSSSNPIGWNGDPVLYWPNGSDSYFFRALATYSKNSENKDKLTAVEGSKNVEQGTDLLWAQTSAHTGTEADGTTTNDYAVGAAINPRTGDVPLTFEHVMSKITVNLQNKYSATDVPSGVTATDYTDPRNPLVNLAGAKIQISNIKKTGTVSLVDGAVSPSGDAVDMFVVNTTEPRDERRLAANDTQTSDKLTEYSVIPQDIADATYLIITLTDGTVYKIQLNTCLCETTSSTVHTVGQVIDKWNRGVNYTYTITVCKEGVSFIANVKNWETATGSGDAILEWN